MNKSIYSLVFLCSLAFSPLSGQSLSYERDQWLKEIEKNNTTLTALRQKNATEKLQNRTGNALPDPKIGFANTWGNQPTSVTKQNFSIEQELEWGSISGQRKKLTQVRNKAADLEYALQRQTILSEADQYLILMVFYNALYAEWCDREARARELKLLYEKKFAAGDATQLDLNKVKLNHTACRAEMQKAKALREENKAQLQRLNGNIAMELEQRQYANATLPPLADLLEKNRHRIPELEKARHNVLAERQELKLSKTEGLPNLSIGYAGEIAKGDNTNGITLGMNIPLWGNSRRNVKQQKAEVLLAEMEQKDTELQISNQLSRQYANAYSLSQIATQFRKELNEYEDQSILDKALDNGQLSVIDYLNEIAFYYAARVQVLEAEKDSQLSLSELWSNFR